MRHSLRLRANATLSAKSLVEALHQRHTEAFFGLPDHALQPIISYVLHHTSPHDRAVCSSAEQVLGFAAGYHTATGKVPCLYSPHRALLDFAKPLRRHQENPLVAPLPCVMLVGCSEVGPARAETVERCLVTMGVPHVRLDQDKATPDGWGEVLDRAYAELSCSSAPVAVLIEASSVEPYRSSAVAMNAIEGLTLTMTTAAEQLARQINASDVVVCSTGVIAEVLCAVRGAIGHHDKRTHVVPHGADVASIAAGFAMASPDVNVYSIQTDTESLPHLSAFATQGHIAAAVPLSATPGTGPLSNLKHVVMNCGVHLSGARLCSTGIPTAAFDASIAGVAKACGCALVREEPVLDVGDLVSALGDMRQTTGPCLLEVVVLAPDSCPPHRRE